VRFRLGVLVLAVAVAACGDSGRPPGGAPADSIAAAPADSAVRPAVVSLDLGTPEGREQLDDDLLHAVVPGDTVRLDLALSPDQIHDLPSVISDGWWIALTYRGDDGAETGSELHILFGPEGQRGDLVVDSTGATPRLRGRISIREVRGPHMGLMSIFAAPVR
jgi:hypothetical protein